MDRVMFLNIGFYDQSKLFFFAVLYLQREKKWFQTNSTQRIGKKIKTFGISIFKKWLDVKRSSFEISP